MVKDQNTNIFWQPGKVSYKERCCNLHQKGVVVWFTGLSGAGKSTIAIEVEKELLKIGKATYILDGDNIRHGLNVDLGFTQEDRNENIRRIAEVAALFKDAGLIILVCCISPNGKMRSFAREKAGNNDFIEIYVKADLGTCSARDPKGLYAKAKREEICDFTGITAPYEEPASPELIIDTTQLSLEKSVSRVLNAIKNSIELKE